MAELTDPQGKLSKGANIEMNLNPTEYATRCEGSSELGRNSIHEGYAFGVSCKMCGQLFTHCCDFVPDHDRLDILRMLTEGHLDEMTDADARELAAQAHEMGLW